MKAKKWLTASVVLVCIAIIVFIFLRDDESRFIKAVQDGDIKTVRSMLNKKGQLANTQRPHKAGSTPVLYTALSRGHNEIVKLLLSHGASPKDNPRALRYANSPEMAELLIKYGADVNWRDGNNYALTALHSSAATNDTKMIELLLNHGAEINVENGIGATPLHLASKEGRLNAVKLLIAKGADINAKSREGKTPFDYAVFPVWNEDAYHLQSDRINRCKEVAAFLLTFKPAYTISDIAWIGDMERLAEIIQNDPETANFQAHREFPLFAAIRGNNPQAVEYLLTHGAQLSVTGRFGQSPLQLAAYLDYADIAKIILNHDADIDEKGRWGETALHWAVVRGNKDIALLLLECGSNPNSMASGYTIDIDLLISKDTDPMEFELKRFDMEQAILRAKRANRSIQVAPPPKLAFTTNDTPLHAACYWNHIDIVRLLIKNGADVNAVDAWGITPLLYAVVCRYDDIVQMLLDHGANPQVKAHNGMTAVEIARRVKDKKLAKLLNNQKYKTQNK
ncbi:MAG: ankyrin repeat domain-containing protein [Sedimentisphaerales bacterium]|nr:ankyrin repeat domain-containing protein [Sedimentisphaerales bacterium]